MMTTAPIIVIAGLASAFFAGWYGAGLYQDSQQLLIERAATETAAKNRQYTEQIASDSARLLESKLEELRANEIHTEKVIQKELVKPVFSNICASDEYVRLFNAAAERTERALSGKPVNPLPDHPATPER